MAINALKREKIELIRNYDKLSSIGGKETHPVIGQNGSGVLADTTEHTVHLRMLMPILHLERVTMVSYIVSASVADMLVVDALLFIVLGSEDALEVDHDSRLALHAPHVVQRVKGLIHARI